MVRLLALLALLFPLVAMRPAEPEGKRYALLIGVNEYEDTSIGSLRFAVADARGMATAFQKLGFSDTVVLASDASEPQGKPTRANVIDRLEQLSAILKPEDTFVFYFSGHGFTLDGKSFLGTADCRAGSADSLEDTALSVDLLKRRIGRISALHRVFILDSCRNDPTAKAKGTEQGRTSDFSKAMVEVSRTAETGEPGSAVLFACQEGKRSYEFDKGGHGAFTYFLLKALDDPAAAEPDGTLSPYSVTKFAQKLMESWGLQSGNRQTPDPLIVGALGISFGRVLAGPSPKTPTPTPTPTPTAGAAVNLVFQPKVNSPVLYDEELSMVLPDVGTVTLKLVQTVTIKKVSSDGSYIESSTVQGTAETGGKTVDMPAEVTNTTYSRHGEIIGVEAKDGSLSYSVIMGAISDFHSPSSPIRVGDTWNLHSKAAVSGGDVVLDVTYTAEGTEEMLGYTTMRVRSAGKLSGKGKGTWSATFWVDTKTGLEIKTRGECKTVDYPGAPDLVKALKFARTLRE
jgi:hypothetical protein